ncbi:non-specific lipid-transfer protein A-like [Dorcoceras hygrometricum]|uniref:Non-specific lipid-transfer protein n=1 Tax=Dorcoceras hygrometricum TaxID=472368 RepID=A0A2Z7CXW8_9LAMI|nr:non-specific lipid-transfer protein A-like [Dorcoceras hygrometricum]
MKGFVAIFLVVVSLVVRPGEGLSCGDVQGSLSPCLQYLSSGGEPSADCCNGVSNLSNSVQSQQDRQTACNCIKSAASSFSIQPDAAASLPGRCGVSIGYSISPNVDCSS